MSLKSVIGFVLITFSLSIQAETVRICDDGAEWPPYAYYERESGVADKNKLTGATIDLVAEIFREIDLEYSITLLPWKRCMQEVEYFGTSGKYEVFINGSFNQERHDKFLMSAPLYKTHNGVFYSKKRFPGELPFKSAADLNKFNLCGVHGYNFEPFISAGVTASIATNAKSNADNLTKVIAQRCDFFLSAIEPVYGGHAIGQHVIPEEIMSARIPDTKKFTFYLFVSKSSPRAHELYTNINQAIVKLYENGTTEKIYKNYLPQGTGL